MLAGRLKDWWINGWVDLWGWCLLRGAAGLAKRVKPNQTQSNPIKPKNRRTEEMSRWEKSAHFRRNS
jgi:hypothetical protein